MKRTHATVGILLLAAFAAPLAASPAYVEVFPFANFTSIDATVDTHQICNSEGTTAYSIVRAGVTGARHSYIMKTTNLGGTPTTSVLSDTATWGGSGVTGIDYMTPGNSMSVVGSNLLFADTRSKQVLKVDKTTGLPSVYVSAAQLTSQLGGNTITVSNTATPAGEYIFYESVTKQIAVTTGAGAVSTLVTSAQLTAAQGNNNVAGGLTFDSAGSLYWGNSTSKTMWKRDTGGAISQVLSTANITAVTGAASTGFGDIFFAPNGMVYFRDTSAQAVLSFNPANPASSLAIVLSTAQLTAGPAGSAFVDPFSWYAGTNNLAFATLTSGGKGYYAIPEPATLALLGLGGLIVARRRHA